MSVAIQIENVSKQYRLGEVGTGTLSHDLHRAWAKMLGKPDPFTKIGGANNREEAGGEYVWALKDITFTANQGSILGIIGRNGAGKSTLLKLLSRVTAPTTGSIKTKGRIASLLEVGTGFHPELTGRENIYLNGTILGMKRKEITRQLEEIVEFSGCAKYLDTPVKRYSSGMVVRLGFSVAAHLQCEILIVDEVLAVGDAEFQRRCVGKMKQISETGGRTVLFVSHNMAAVRNLCTSCVVMEQGEVALIGSTDQAMERYQSADVVRSNESIADRHDRGGVGAIRFTDFVINDNTEVTSTSPIRFTLHYKKLDGEKVNRPRVVIGIYDINNTSIYRFDTDIQAGLPVDLPASGDVTCETAALQATPGPLYVSIAFFENGILQDHVVNAARMDVAVADFFDSTQSFNRADCLLLTKHSWRADL